MFEINITNNSTSPFSVDAGKWHGYDATLHRAYHYSSFGINISGLSYKNENDDVFENEHFLIIRCGQIFYSLKHKDNLSPLSASDIFSLYLSKDVSFLDEIKGNFIIVIYSKINNKLIVAKDKLGLKYIYYKTGKDFYYISTNLNDFKRLNNKLDGKTILQHLVFSYPIGNSTFIKDVKFLEMGSFLLIHQNSTTIKHYFSVNDIFVKSHDIKKFQKNHFVNLFEKSVIQRANVSASPNVSLTGGFDGRAVSATLIKAKRDFQAYSFGMKGGENTEVPLKVSKKIGLDYNPIYLDDEYEKEYFSCAKDAIYFSDGISKFERANYIYAMQKLAPKSHINITGLIGGEIFGAVHFKKDYINGSYFDTIYLLKDIVLQHVLKDKNINNFFSYNFINDNSLTEFFQSIDSRRKMISEWRANELSWMYYLKDMISLGFQRFYGNQMHIERYYCDNLSPFYDIDILEYLFSTDHINIYKNAFKNSAFFRIRNRKLQSIIIKDQSNILGELAVDRGYPSNYNLDIRKLLIPYFFYKRKKNITKQKPDFNSPHWCKLLFERLLEEPSHYQSNLINFKKLTAFMTKYQPLQYNSEITRLISLYLWMSNS